VELVVVDRTRSVVEVGESSWGESSASEVVSLAVSTVRLWSADDTAERRHENVGASVSDSGTKVPEKPMGPAPVTVSR
jgi:hypothetical protein